MPTFDLALLTRGHYHDLLLAGLTLSLELLVITLVLALPFSLLIALARLSPWPVLRWAGFGLVEGVRNVPLLAQMLFWYFGAPELLPDASREWLYGHNFEAIAAVVALLFYTSAFLSEDIRSGIRAVPQVQTEAARALGLGYLATLRLVVLPQALRITVPPLISQTLNLWKNTSIATVIGTAELMYQAGQVESATFRSIEAFSFATASYLIVSLLITGLSALYQHHFPARSA
ncbi:MAG: amino acid ABC transporter permease [Curvibacter sp.]|nr:amino acid ABC transporter permease [Curvibacter sp.]